MEGLSRSTSFSSRLGLSEMRRSQGLLGASHECISACPQAAQDSLCTVAERPGELPKEGLPGDPTEDSDTPVCNTMQQEDRSLHPATGGDAPEHRGGLRRVKVEKAGPAGLCSSE